MILTRSSWKKAESAIEAMNLHTFTEGDCTTFILSHCGMELGTLSEDDLTLINGVFKKIAYLVKEQYSLTLSDISAKLRAVTSNLANDNLKRLADMANDNAVLGASKVNSSEIFAFTTAHEALTLTGTSGDSVFATDGVVVARGENDNSIKCIAYPVAIAEDSEGNRPYFIVTDKWGGFVYCNPEILTTINRLDQLYCSWECECADETWDTVGTFMLTDLFSVFDYVGDTFVNLGGEAKFLILPVTGYIEFIDGLASFAHNGMASLITNLLDWSPMANENEIGYGTDTLMSSNKA